MKTFNEQAQASIDEIDMEAAQKRLDAMNLSKPGPTLTPQPQTQPQAPYDVEWSTECEVCHKPIVRRGRNRLSNCGHMRMSGGGWVAKDAKPKAPADPDEIMLRVPLGDARLFAMAAAKNDCAILSSKIQDQIIAQLQKKIDALQKQK